MKRQPEKALQWAHMESNTQGKDLIFAAMYALTEHKRDEVIHVITQSKLSWREIHTLLDRAVAYGLLSKQTQKKIEKYVNHDWWIWVHPITDQIDGYGSMYAYPTKLDFLIDRMKMERSVAEDYVEGGLSEEKEASLRIKRHLNTFEIDKFVKDWNGGTL